MLKFSPMGQNAKLVKLLKAKGINGRNAYTFSMLAGVACPGAKDCKSQAVVQSDGTMRIRDGKHTIFRCFSASQEVLFPAVYNQRKHNLDTIRACGNNLNKLIVAIDESLPQNAQLVRIHISGDFVTQNYFDAWCVVAKRRPNCQFYAYTKSLPFWVKRRYIIPENFVLTASRGGRYDYLIDGHNLREALVVGTIEQAEELGLPIDHTDELAMDRSVHKFLLLVHGSQGVNLPFNKYIKRGRNKSLHLTG
jgi:hypothetical protein